MKRTFTLSALTLTLILAGCGAAPSSPAEQPVVPAGTAVSSAASSTARSSDAKPLGMTQAELRTQISAGKSIKDILKSRGVKVPVTASSSSTGVK